jgi:hypothetical protein
MRPQEFRQGPGKIPGSSTQISPGSAIAGDGGLDQRDHFMMIHLDLLGLPVEKA